MDAWFDDKETDDDKDDDEDDSKTLRSFLGSSNLARLFAGRSLLKKIMITAVCLLVFSFETVN